MLTPEGCRDRRDRLWNALPESCDVLVLADPVHLTYFANYYASPFVFRGNESAAYLILWPDRSVLVGDGSLGMFLSDSHVDEVVAPVWYQGKKSAGHRRAQAVASALDVLKRRAFSRVGIEASSVPAGLLESLRSDNSQLATFNLDPVIRPLRRVKDPDELAILKQSLCISDMAMAVAMESIEPWISERKAYEIVLEAAMAAAGRQVWVYGDFVSGPRCEKVGGPPSERIIKEGELVLLDYSIILNGYRGDVANTFLPGGDAPPPQWRELYEVCMEAMRAGESLLKPGIPAREVDRASRGCLAAHGLDIFSPSHTGHGLGLGHPEPPYIVPDSSDILLEGDIVTLEPGVYLPGVAGMRFEHNYRIGPDGPERLSNHRLTLQVV